MIAPGSNRGGRKLVAYLALAWLLLAAGSFPRLVRGQQNLWWQESVGRQDDAAGQEKIAGKENLAGQRNQPGQENDAKERDRYRVAVTHFAEGRWEFAVAELSEYLAQWPQSPKAPELRVYLAESLIQLRRLPEAREYFEGISQDLAEKTITIPERLQGLVEFRLGELPFLTQAYPEAETRLQNFLTTYPKHFLAPFAANYLGQISLAKNDLSNAERLFREAIERFSEHIAVDECRFGLAQVLERQGKLEEAARLYLALSGKPLNPLATESLFRLARIQSRLGFVEDALASFQELERAATDDLLKAKAKLAQGKLLIRMGRHPEARPLLQEVTPFESLAAEAYFWLGTSYWAERYYREASEAFAASLGKETDPHRIPLARLRLADSLLAAGQAAEALVHYDQLLKGMIDDGRPGNPLVPYAAIGMARVLLKQGRHAEAAESCRRVLAAPQGINPECRDALRVLAGIALVHMQCFEEAESILAEKVDPPQEIHNTSEIDHTSSGAISKGDLKADSIRQLFRVYLLALAKEGQGRYAEALEDFCRVSKEAGGDLTPFARLGEARCMIGQSRFQEAAELLSGLRSADTPPPVALKAYSLSIITQIRLGNWDAAKSAYADFIQRDWAEAEIVELLHAVARELAHSQPHPWALEVFSELAGRKPNSPLGNWVLLQLAWCEYRLGLQQKAEKTLRILVGKVQEEELLVEAALLRGQILEELGSPDEALLMYRRAVEGAAGQKLAEAIWYLASCYHRLKRWAEASTWYRKLDEEFPSFLQADQVLYFWALAERAAHSVQAGQEAGPPKPESFGEAESLLEKLRKRFPNSAYWFEATLLLAEWATESGRLDRAQKFLDELSTRATESVAATPRHRAKYLQGELHLLEGRWDEAEQIFRGLLAEQPEPRLGIQAQFGMAEALYRQNAYEEALSEFEAFLKTACEKAGLSEPWCSLARLRKLQILCHQRWWPEAIELAEELWRNPSDQEHLDEVCLLRGTAHFGRAEFAEARNWFERAIEFSKGNNTAVGAEAQFMIAETFLHQGDYRQALREYLRLDILYPLPQWRAPATLQAGKCYEKLGRYQEAAGQYRRLLQEWSQSPWAQEAEERLRVLDGSPQVGVNR